MTAMPHLVTYTRRPNALAFMAGAFLPSPGWRAGQPMPALALRWNGLVMERGRLIAFSQATQGPTQGPAVDEVSVLFPHAAGFRLSMALLTHRAFPLPIWRALQIRDQLCRHRRIRADEAFDLHTCIAAHRLVGNGLEVDLHSRLLGGDTPGQRDECAWESTVTFLFRGRFGGQADPPAATPGPQPDLTGVPPDAPPAQPLTLPTGGGWAFGELTGDYNGLHWSDRYARRSGFRAAFPHPARLAGLCLAHLRGPDTPRQQLDLWVKGPVFYGADAELRHAAIAQGLEFGLALTGDPRQALLGRWRALD